MTHSAVLLTIDALAVFRVTRLIVADGITAPWRGRIAQGGRAKLSELVTCPWCVSPYVAVIVVICQRFVPHAWLYVALVLAFSAVAGLLAEHS